MLNPKQNSLNAGTVLSRLIGRPSIQAQPAARSRSGRQRARRAARFDVDDMLVAAIFCVAPLIMGGRSELGRAVYVLLVGLMGLHWLLPKWRSSTVRWRTTGVGWLLASGFLVVVLQIMPLRSAWIEVLSPALADLLPCWGWGAPDEVQLGTWNRISLDPHATIFALVVYAAHACLFLLLVQRLQSTSDVERLLKLLAVAVIFVAALAIVQYLSQTERFVWIFRHPSRNPSHLVCGPFENSNHFAHLLSLGIAPILWWLNKSLEPVRRGPTGNRTAGHIPYANPTSVGLLLALGVVVFAALLSCSRGGILMLLLGCSVCLTGSVVLGAMPRKVLLALGGALGMVLVALLIYGSDAVSSELGTLTSGSIRDLDYQNARQHIWRANLEVSRHFPLFGTGVGSHAEVYKLFFPFAPRVEYTHAESGYINLLTETGWVGTALFITGIAICLYWLYRGYRSTEGRVQLLTVVVASGMAVSLVHSLFDFPWYLASCMSFTVAYCACAYRLSQPAVESASAISLPLGLTRLCTVAACGGFAGAVAILIGPAIGSIYFNQYLCLSRGAAQSTMRQGLAVKKYGEVTQAERADYELRCEMVEVLNRTLAWDPHHPVANLRLATSLFSSFELLQQFNRNAMSLSQIRDAALASRFPNTTALQNWLQVAIGNNLQLLSRCQARANEAVAWSPLEGRAYLLLANLAFLDGQAADVAQSLKRQAERVRPYDAAIMFAAGSDAAIAGDIQSMMAYWKRAYEQDEDYQKPIMLALGARLSAKFVIETFHPNRSVLTMLHTYYQEQGMTEQLTLLAPYLIEALESEAEHLSGDRAASLLMQSVAICRSVGDGSRAIKNAQQAVEQSPNLFDPHRVLAQQLMIEKHYDAAIEHLMWCVRNRPCDQQLKQTLDAARIARRRDRGIPARAVSGPHHDGG